MTINIFCGPSFRVAFFCVVTAILLHCALGKNPPNFFVRFDGKSCHYCYDNPDYPEILKLKIERFFVYKQMYIFVTHDELFYLNKEEAERCGGIKQLTWVTEEDRVNEKFDPRKYTPKEHFNSSLTKYCALYGNKIGTTTTTTTTTATGESTAQTGQKNQSKKRKKTNDEGHVVQKDYHILYKCTEKTKEFCGKDDDSFFLNEHTGKLHFFPASDEHVWELCLRDAYDHLQKITFSPYLYYLITSDTEESDNNDDGEKASKKFKL